LGVLATLVHPLLLPPALETVVINTGHGLKTLDAVGDAVGPAATIDPSYAAFVATGIA
jgi:threonine synthase